MVRITQQQLFNAPEARLVKLVFRVEQNSQVIIDEKQIMFPFSVDKDYNLEVLELVLKTMTQFIYNELDGKEDKDNC